MERFTIQDLEDLNKALEAWASEPLEHGLLGAMLGTVLSNEEDKEKKKEDFSNKIAKASSEANGRKETIILLQAKLIQMKKELMVSEFVEDATKEVKDE